MVASSYTNDRTVYRCNLTVSRNRQTLNSQQTSICTRTRGPTYGTYCTRRPTYVYVQSHTQACRPTYVHVPWARTLGTYSHIRRHVHILYVPDGRGRRGTLPICLRCPCHTYPLMADGIIGLDEHHAIDHLERCCLDDTALLWLYRVVDQTDPCTQEARRASCAACAACSARGLAEA